MAGLQYGDHGNRCSCRLLAELVGCDPKTIRFTYCQAVLMKHWVIECNHLCHDDVPAELGRSSKWRDIGPIDPVKTILIKYW